MVPRIIVFRREAAWRQGPDPGTDNQGAIRAGQRRAKSLDGVLVDLTAFLKLRPVVDEGAVNHAIRLGCTATRLLPGVLRQMPGTRLQKRADLPALPE